MQSVQLPTKLPSFVNCSLFYIIGYCGGSLGSSSNRTDRNMVLNTNNQ